jgi:uncharacterized protein YdeI (YjbR/CyaY-like superfamily)
MANRDPRIDVYIAKSADFAKPILSHLRKLVHAGCPDVEETLKWGFPHFLYNGILCSMASFKSHCAFGFWKGKLIVGANANKAKEATGQFGRITDVSTLPPDKTIIGYVKEAMRLNDAGIKSPTRSQPNAKKPITVPAYFRAALAKNKKAGATFAGFNYSNKKEYVEWVVEAKTESTRQTRLETAVKWMAQGKVRNWKYLK